jgi:hypothetical protein
MDQLITTRTEVLYVKKTAQTCSRICSLVLLLLLSSCATIFKGDRADVELIAPDTVDVRITHVDSAHPVQVKYTTSGMRYITLPTDDTHILQLQVDGRLDTVVLEPELNGNYVLADILMWPGLIVDGVTGNWNDFGGASLVMQPLDSISNGMPRWRVVTSEPFGLILTGFMGVNGPIVQVPIFGNVFGLGIGYMVHPDFHVLGMYTSLGCTDLSDYQGNVRITDLNCDLIVDSWMLNTRYYPTHLLVDSPSPLGGVYVMGGVGINRLQADTLLRDPYMEFGRRIDKTIPAAMLGFGICGGPVFLEYSWTWGLERIDLGDNSSGAVRFRRFRFGVNLIL